MVIGPEFTFNSALSIVINWELYHLISYPLKYFHKYITVQDPIPHNGTIMSEKIHKVKGKGKESIPGTLKI